MGVQCRLSILRNGRVALSNLRVKGPSTSYRWPLNVTAVQDAPHSDFFCYTLNLFENNS